MSVFLDNVSATIQIQNRCSLLLGGAIMTIMEQKLVDLIRDHPTPDVALLAAISVISEFLTQPLSSEGTVPSVHQKLV